MPRGRQSKKNKKTREITLKRCLNHINTTNVIGERVTYHKKSLEVGYKGRLGLHPVTHKGEDYIVSMIDGKPVGVAKLSGSIAIVNARCQQVNNIQVEVITKYYSSICKV